MITKASDEYVKMKEQLQAYSTKTQELGKGHGLGPPCLSAFGGLLEALLARGTAVGALTNQKLQEAQKKWEELEVEAAYEWIPHCKLRKCYEDRHDVHGAQGSVEDGSGADGGQTITWTSTGGGGRGGTLEDPPDHEQVNRAPCSVAP